MVSPFSGLTTEEAVKRLSTVLRSVLADDARRLDLETRREFNVILFRQFFSPHHRVMLIACGLLIAGFAYGADSPSSAASESVIISAVFILLNVFIDVGLVMRRMHILRWEIHSKFSEALLEFERASGVFDSHLLSSKSSTNSSSESGATITRDGIVLNFNSLWEALDFHETSKLAYTVPVYRDGRWVRLPVPALVKGDLVALMAKDSVPFASPLDDSELGSRGRYGRSLSRNLISSQLPNRSSSQRASVRDMDGNGSTTNSGSRVLASVRRSAHSLDPAIRSSHGTLHTASPNPVHINSIPTKKAINHTGLVGVPLMSVPGSLSTPSLRNSQIPPEGMGKAAQQEKARNVHIDTLTLVGDLRRFVLLDSPARNSLRSRLRTQPRPQPLLANEIRSMSRMGDLWRIVLTVVCLLAVMVRTLAINALSDKNLPDHLAGEDDASNTPEGSIQALKEPFTSLSGGLLIQVPVLLLLTSPLVLPVLLTLAESIGTARVLAAHEMALLRAQWSAWKRSVLQDSMGLDSHPLVVAAANDSAKQGSGSVSTGKGPTGSLGGGVSSSVSSANSAEPANRRRFRYSLGMFGIPASLQFAAPDGGTTDAGVSSTHSRISDLFNIIRTWRQTRNADDEDGRRLRHSSSSSENETNVGPGMNPSQRSAGGTMLRYVRSNSNTRSMSESGTGNSAAATSGEGGSSDVGTGTDNQGSIHSSTYSHPDINGFSEPPENNSVNAGSLKWLFLALRAWFRRGRGTDSEGASSSNLDRTEADRMSIQAAQFITEGDLEPADSSADVSAEDRTNDLDIHAPVHGGPAGADSATAPSSNILSSDQSDSIVSPPVATSLPSTSSLQPDLESIVIDMPATSATPSLGAANAQNQVFSIISPPISATAVLPNGPEVAGSADVTSPSPLSPQTATTGGPSASLNTAPSLPTDAANPKTYDLQSQNYLVNSSNLEYVRNSLLRQEVLYIPNSTDDIVAAVVGDESTEDSSSDDLDDRMASDMWLPKKKRKPDAQTVANLMRARALAPPAAAAAFKALRIRRQDVAGVTKEGEFVPIQYANSFGKHSEVSEGLGVVGRLKAVVQSCRNERRARKKNHALEHVCNANKKIMIGKENDKLQFVNVGIDDSGYEIDSGSESDTVTLSTRRRFNGPSFEDIISAGAMGSGVGVGGTAAPPLSRQLFYLRRVCFRRVRVLVAPSPLPQSVIDRVYEKGPLAVLYNAMWNGILFLLRFFPQQQRSNTVEGDSPSSNGLSNNSRINSISVSPLADGTVNINMNVSLPTETEKASSVTTTINNNTNSYNNLNGGNSAAAAAGANSQRSAAIIAHTIQQQSLRWSNFTLADDLTDVGFGLRPIPTPALSHQLLSHLGTSTVFMVADRATVCEREPTVENIMLLKGEAGSVFVDIRSDEAGVNGIAFEDTSWQKHLPVLKPIGLACALASCPQVSASDSSGITPNGAEESSITGSALADGVVPPGAHLPLQSLLVKKDKEKDKLKEEKEREQRKEAEAKAKAEKKEKQKEKERARRDRKEREKAHRKEKARHIRRKLRLRLRMKIKEQIKRKYIRSYSDDDDSRRHTRTHDRDRNKEKKMISTPQSARSRDSQFQRRDSGNITPLNLPVLIPTFSSPTSPRARTSSLPLSLPQSLASSDGISPLFPAPIPQNAGLTPSGPTTPLLGPLSVPGTLKGTLTDAQPAVSDVEKDRERVSISQGELRHFHKSTHHRSKHESRERHARSSRAHHAHHYQGTDSGTYAGKSGAPKIPTKVRTRDRRRRRDASRKRSRRKRVKGELSNQHSPRSVSTQSSTRSISTAGTAKASVLSIGVGSTGASSVAFSQMRDTVVSRGRKLTRERESSSGGVTGGTRAESPHSVSTSSISTPTRSFVMSSPQARSKAVNAAESAVTRRHTYSRHPKRAENLSRGSRSPSFSSFSSASPRSVRSRGRSSSKDSDYFKDDRGYDASDIDSSSDEFVSRRSYDSRSSSSFRSRSARSDSSSSISSADISLSDSNASLPSDSLSDDSVSSYRSYRARILERYRRKYILRYKYRYHLHRAAHHRSEGAVERTRSISDASKDLSASSKDDNEYSELSESVSSSSLSSEYSESDSYSSGSSFSVSTRSRSSESSGTSESDMESQSSLSSSNSSSSGSSSTSSATSTATESSSFSMNSELHLNQMDDWDSSVASTTSSRGSRNKDSDGENDSSGRSNNWNDSELSEGSSGTETKRRRRKNRSSDSGNESGSGRRSVSSRSADSKSRSRSRSSRSGSSRSNSGSDEDEDFYDEFDNDINSEMGSLRNERGIWYEDDGFLYNSVSDDEDSFYDGENDYDRDSRSSRSASYSDRSFGSHRSSHRSSTDSERSRSRQERHRSRSMDSYDARSSSSRSILSDSDSDLSRGSDRRIKKDRMRSKEKRRGIRSRNRSSSDSDDYSDSDNSRLSEGNSPFTSKNGSPSSFSSDSSASRSRQRSKSGKRHLSQSHHTHSHRPYADDHGFHNRTHNTLDIVMETEADNENENEDNDQILSQHSASRNRRESISDVLARIPITKNVASAEELLSSDDEAIATGKSSPTAMANSGEDETPEDMENAPLPGEDDTIGDSTPLVLDSQDDSQLNVADLTDMSRSPEMEAQYRRGRTRSADSASYQSRSDSTSSFSGSDDERRSKRLRRSTRSSRRHRAKEREKEKEKKEKKKHRRRRHRHGSSSSSSASESDKSKYGASSDESSSSSSSSASVRSGSSRSVIIRSPMESDFMNAADAKAEGPSTPHTSSFTGISGHPSTLTSGRPSSQSSRARVSTFAGSAGAVSRPATSTAPTSTPTSLGNTANRPPKPSPMAQKKLPDTSSPLNTDSSTAEGPERMVLPLSLRPSPSPSGSVTLRSRSRDRERRVSRRLSQQSLRRTESESSGAATSTPGIASSSVLTEQSHPSALSLVKGNTPTPSASAATASLSTPVVDEVSLSKVGSTITPSGRSSRRVSRRPGGSSPSPSAGGSGLGEGTRVAVGSSIAAASSSVLLERARAVEAERVSLAKLADKVKQVPPLRWLDALSKEIGFTPTDLANFVHVRHIYTLSAQATEPTSINGGTSRKLLLPGKSDKTALQPSLQATVVLDKRSGLLQMTSQGNVPFLLSFCSNYWDGSVISELTQNRRSTILNTYQQWVAEDMECVGIAYDPVSREETEILKILESSWENYRSGGASVMKVLKEIESRSNPAPAGSSSMSVATGSTAANNLNVHSQGSTVSAKDLGIQEVPSLSTLHSHRSSEGNSIPLPKPTSAPSTPVVPIVYGPSLPPLSIQSPTVVTSGVSTISNGESVPDASDSLAIVPASRRSHSRSHRKEYDSHESSHSYPHANTNTNSHQHHSSRSQSTSTHHNHSNSHSSNHQSHNNNDIHYGPHLPVVRNKSMLKVQTRLRLARLITPFDIGLGFGSHSAFLLMLNYKHLMQDARLMPVDLSSNLNGNTRPQHSMETKTPLLTNGVSKVSSALLTHGTDHNATNSSSPVVSSTASEAEQRLLRMQSGQIFLGIAAARFQPQPRTQGLIKSLDKQGVRFAYMTARNYQQTKPLAHKMGLETGWNCAISLQPRKRSRLAMLHPLLNAAGGGGASGAVTSSTALNTGPSGTDIKVGESDFRLGEFALEEDEQLGFDPSTMTDEMRRRIIQAEIDEQLWDIKAQLPHGVPEIRSHIRETDNVPLLVSLFTDCTPPAIAGMIRTMQENGESVLVICSAIKRSAPLLLNVADIGIVTGIYGGKRMPLVRTVSNTVRLKKPFLLTNHDERTLLQNSREIKIDMSSKKGNEDPIGVAEPSSNSSGTTTSTNTVNIGVEVPNSSSPRNSSAELLSSESSVATPLPLEHPILRMVTALTSIHASLTLAPGTSLHVLLRAIRESRRGLAVTKQSLLFQSTVQYGLAMLLLVNVCVAMPQSLPPHAALWLVWVITPIVSLTLLFADHERSATGKIEERMPGKRRLMSERQRGDALSSANASSHNLGSDSGAHQVLWDILPGPEAQLPPRYRDGAGFTGDSINQPDPLNQKIDPKSPEIRRDVRDENSKESPFQSPSTLNLMEPSSSHAPTTSTQPGQTLLSPTRSFLDKMRSSSVDNVAQNTLTMTLGANAGHTESGLTGSAGVDAADVVLNVDGNGVPDVEIEVTESDHEPSATTESKGISGIGSRIRSGSVTFLDRLVPGSGIDDSASGNNGAAANKPVVFDLDVEGEDVGAFGGNDLINMDHHDQEHIDEHIHGDSQHHHHDSVDDQLEYGRNHLDDETLDGSMDVDIDSLHYNEQDHNNETHNSRENQDSFSSSSEFNRKVSSSSSNRKLSTSSFRSRHKRVYEENQSMKDGIQRSNSGYENDNENEDAHDSASMTEFYDQRGVGDGNRSVFAARAGSVINADSDAYSERASYSSFDVSNTQLGSEHSKRRGNRGDSVHDTGYDSYGNFTNHSGINSAPNSRTHSVMGDTDTDRDGAAGSIRSRSRSRSRTRSPLRTALLRSVVTPSDKNRLPKTQTPRSTDEDKVDSSLDNTISNVASASEMNEPSMNLVRESSTGSKLPVTEMSVPGVDGSERRSHRSGARTSRSMTRDSSVSANEGHRRGRPRSVSSKHGGTPGKAELASDALFAPSGNNGKNTSHAGTRRSVSYHSSVEQKDASMKAMNPPNNAEASAPEAVRSSVGAFDPSTGGVRAEALIRFSSYCDLTSYVAGGCVEICDASTALAAKKLASSDESGTSSSNENARKGLTAATAAARLDFAMNIPPAQGLLVPAPKPPLPTSYVTLSVYALLLLVPLALVHEYLFERSLSYYLDNRSLLLNGDFGDYPLFSVLANVSSVMSNTTTDFVNNTSSDDLQVINELTFESGLAHAQALIYLSITVWIIMLSLNFYFPLKLLWEQNPLKSSSAWVLGSSLAFILQLAHSHVLTSLVGAPSLFSEQPWDIWFSLVLFHIGSIVLASFIKRHYVKNALRDIKMQRLLFDTRLGMYSPR